MTTVHRTIVKIYGLQTPLIMPCYLQANGMVEKFNTMLTKIRMIATVVKKNWKQELFKFLRSYRTTPDGTTGETPADLLFHKRNFSTSIPEIAVKISNSDIRNRDRKNKTKIKKYTDQKSDVKKCVITGGDSVLVKKR